MPPPQTRNMFMFASRAELDQLPVLFLGDPRGKTVGRNPVGALGKDRNTIDHKSETLAGFIRLLAEFQGTQAGACAFLIDLPAVRSAAVP